ncbi:tyrosine-type recombinase/integrase [Marivivens marinus]|uniref:tyrosine-type recombinase/integrase n=1 Tax=Marivivens marinus TaxID=3110173 RepID=UPI003B8450D7
MSTHIKYAYKRHNTWFYRRAYPVKLQPLLGSSLKRSLHTNEARVAAQRVADLNATFTAIVTEASHKIASGDSGQVPIEIAVTLPNFHRARLLGDQKAADAASAYLSEASQRLRPGSYKSVRYALSLLTSHLGTRQLRDLSAPIGKEVLGYVGRLSPNVRKYSDAEGATLAELATLAEKAEGITLTAQTQRRIWRQMLHFLDWCVQSGRLKCNPWDGLQVKEQVVVSPHQVLTDDQVVRLLNSKDRVLHSALLFCLLTGLRSGEVCGLLAEDILSKGNLGRFVRVQPNTVRQLKSRAAEREVPLHPILEQQLDRNQSAGGRLFPSLNVDRVVRRYAYLRSQHPQLRGTVFHSTRKWFITQCERTGAPEHFTASLVGHQSARSQNRLTYGLYSAGISDTQKREIIDQIRLPQGVKL